MPAATLRSRTLREKLAPLAVLATFLLGLWLGWKAWWRPTLATLQKVEPGMRLEQVTVLLGTPADEVSYQCSWFKNAITTGSSLWWLTLTPSSAWDSSYKVNLEFKDDWLPYMRPPEVKHHFWVIQDQVFWVVTGPDMTVLRMRLLHPQKIDVTGWEKLKRQISVWFGSTTLAAPRVEYSPL